MTAAYSIFQQVHRLACELYDARDEDDHRRDLERFEQDFLTQVKDTQSRCAGLVGHARRNPNMKPDDVARIEYLARRQEEKELRNALLIYRDAKDRFDNPAAYDGGDELFQLAAE